MNKMFSSWARTLAAIVASVYFFTNVAMAYTQEKNIWTERRRHIKKSNTVTQDNLLLASLPAASSPMALFQSLSSPLKATSALSDEMAKTLPAGFAAKHSDLFNALRMTHGTIRKVWLPTKNLGDRVVVHIQDVHQNEDAQRHIGGAVDALVQAHQADLVALEGAFAPIDVKAFHDFEDREVIGLTADCLLRENLITGPVHTFMTTKATLPPLVGVDDKTHYDANVEAYRQSAPIMEEMKKTVAAQKFKLDLAKKQVFSPALLAFDSVVGAYKEEKASLADYVAALEPEIAVGQTGLLAQAFKMEKGLDFEKVEKDRKGLIDVLVKNINKTQTDQLMMKNAGYRTGEVRYGEFYRYLKNLCRSVKVNLAQFPRMDAYIKYVMVSDRIDGEKLLYEMASLEKGRYAALTMTKEEKVLVAQSHQLHLRSRLLNFALTPVEWAEYQSLKSLEVPSPVGGRGNGEGGRSTLLNLSSFESFYEQAQIRNEDIARNLLSSMDKGHATRAVLVTGGYHTEGVSERLRNAGVTVITFTPRIEKVDTKNGSAYLSIFTQEKTPLEKLFAGEKLFVTQSPWALEKGGVAGPALVAGAAVERSGNPAVARSVFQRVGGSVKLSVTAAIESQGVVKVKLAMAGAKEALQVSVRNEAGQLTFTQQIVSVGAFVFLLVAITPILQTALTGIFMSLHSFVSALPGLNMLGALTQNLVDFTGLSSVSHRLGMPLPGIDSILSSNSLNSFVQLFVSATFLFFVTQNWRNPPGGNETRSPLKATDSFNINTYVKMTLLAFSTFGFVLADDGTFHGLSSFFNYTGILTEAVETFAAGWEIFLSFIMNGQTILLFIPLSVFLFLLAVVFIIRLAHTGFLNFLKSSIVGAAKWLQKLKITPALYPYIYISSTILGAIGLTVLTSSFIDWETSNVWNASFVVILMFFSNHGLADSLASKLFNPKNTLLPGLDFGQDIPDDHKAIMYYPIILKNKSDLDFFEKNLAPSMEANSDKNLTWVVMSTSDSPLRKKEQEYILALQKRFRSQRLLYFHRDSGVNNWEMKRGGYMHFLLWLRQGRDSNGNIKKDVRFPSMPAGKVFDVIIGDTATLEDTNHFLISDSDFKWPAGAAHRLVSKMAHPGNSRFTIFQSLAEPHNAHDSILTLLTGLATTDWHLPWTRTWGMLGQTNFVGSGAGFRIDNFIEGISGKMKEGYLSHDIVESYFTRAALVRDVVTQEEIPVNLVLKLRQWERWWRGNKIAFSLFLPQIRNEQKDLIPNPGTFINKYLIYQISRFYLSNFFVLPYLLLFSFNMFELSSIGGVHGIFLSLLMYDVLLFDLFHSRGTRDLILIFLRSLSGFILNPLICFEVFRFVVKTVWEDVVLFLTGERNILTWIPQRSLTVDLTLKMSLRRFWLASTVGSAMSLLSYVGVFSHWALIFFFPLALGPFLAWITAFPPGFFSPEKMKKRLAEAAPLKSLVFAIAMVSMAVFPANAHGREDLIYDRTPWKVLGTMDSGPSQRLTLGAESPSAVTSTPRPLKTPTAEIEYNKARENVRTMEGFIRSFLKQKGYEVVNEGWLSGIARFYSLPKDGTRPLWHLEEELNPSKLKELSTQGTLLQIKRRDSLLFPKIRDFALLTGGVWSSMALAADSELYSWAGEVGIATVSTGISPVVLGISIIVGFIALFLALRFAIDAFNQGRRDEVAMGEILSKLPVQGSLSLIPEPERMTDAFSSSKDVLARMASAQTKPVRGWIYRMSFIYFAPAGAKKSLKKGLELNNGSLYNARVLSMTVFPAAGVTVKDTLTGMAINAEGMADLPVLLKTIEKRNSENGPKQYFAISPGKDVDLTELSRIVGDHPYVRIVEGNLPAEFVEGVHGALGNFKLNPVTTTIVVISAPEFDNAQAEVAALLKNFTLAGADTEVKRRIAEALLKAIMSSIVISTHEMLMLFQADQLAQRSA
jgi:hypothetical protein